MGTVGSDDRRLRKTVKLQAIRRLCNKLLMIMPNCWRVNESCTVDITELLIQKLSAVFATKNCWNLAATNVIIWILGILKLTVLNSWILGTFEIHKIRILNLWLQLRFDCRSTSNHRRIKFEPHLCNRTHNYRQKYLAGVTRCREMVL